MKSLLLPAAFLLLLTGVLLNEALLFSLPGLPVGVDSADLTCLFHVGGRALDCRGPVCMVHVKFGLPNASFRLLETAISVCGSSLLTAVLVANLLKL